MAKIKLDNDLYKRAESMALLVGYSSLDEFVVHLLEKALRDVEDQGEVDKSVEERLRGLGYLE